MILDHATDDSKTKPLIHGIPHPIFPLGTYPSTQANLLHALPDLSASHHHHHHHPLHGTHPLNTIITNPRTPALYPVHHAHEHHHHHHIAPPFMASLYSPRFPHPTIVSGTHSNPYMPTIDPKLSSSSITMPPIEMHVNNLVPTSSVTDTNKKVIKRRPSSDSSSSSASSSSSSSCSSVSHKQKPDTNDEEEDNLADSDYQNEEDIASDSSENVVTKAKKKAKTKKKKKPKKRKKNTMAMHVSSDQTENEKTLTGVWVVYYTWDIMRDTDMTKPRYEMELKQHKGGNIEGKCIDGSGPAAWTFLLTGKIEKGKTFKYTMHGEDEEIYGKATFDGKDIIKNGMWYIDRLYLRKGGSLVAARKGVPLPKALMQKTDVKKMAKRKRENEDKNDGLAVYIPPAKRQKRTHSRSGSPVKHQKPKNHKENASLPTPPHSSAPPFAYDALNTYQTSGPITSIDGRIVPPEPPPKSDKKRSNKSNVIVIDGSNKSDETTQSEELQQSRANRRHKLKNKKKIKERIKKIRQRKNKNNSCGKGKEAVAPSIPDEYSQCDLTGAWSLYFDNSVSNSASNTKKDSGNNDCDYYDEEDEPINNDTLFLCHNRDTNELSGFVCSPLKCHVTGHVSCNGIDVRLIMIWSPNKELGGQFAGYVTVINGEYDCDRGLNCEYCSFHCTSYFHTMLFRRFENGLSSPLSHEEKMQQFQYHVKAAVDETKYNNSEYVSIVEEWFHQNEKDVSPGQIRNNNNNNNNYSNQCIWRRRKLPITNYNHVHQRISCRKRKRNKQLQVPEFMMRQNRICKNKSNFFFGDLVQLFITFDTVLSHPLSYYVKDCDSGSNYDSDFEHESVSCFGEGKWVDGIIMNVYESKVLVRYFYENALYQQWIDCDINSNNNANAKEKRKVTIQPLIRLRKSLKFSHHLHHIVSQLNRNALSEWRLNLNKSCVCFACDENGEWAKAVIKRRFGCFVYLHWVHFDAKYDEYLSIHSQRIQPLHASDVCNSFRTQLKFQNVLRIKPHKKEPNKTPNQNTNVIKKEKSNDDFQFLAKEMKTTATSNLFGSVILHLQPTNLAN